MLGGEEELGGVAGDVDEAVLVEDGVGVGGEGAAEGDFFVELAGLGEVDGAEEGGFFEGSGGGFELAGEEAEDGGFAGAVGADEADADAVGDEEVEVLDDGAAAEDDGDVFELDEALGLALGGGEVDSGGGGLGALVDFLELADEVVGVVDAGFGLGGAGLGAAAEPVDFDLDAVLEGVLELGLGLHVLLLALDEFGVGAFDAEESVGVDAVELDDFVGDVLEEVAVVGDDDAGEGGLVEELFEPDDSGEVEVVGGLVEEEDVGAGDDGFGDGEAFAPASGEGGGFDVEGFGSRCVRRSRGCGLRARLRRRWRR